MLYLGRARPKKRQVRVKAKSAFKAMRRGFLRFSAFEYEKNNPYDGTPYARFWQKGYDCAEEGKPLPISPF